MDSRGELLTPRRMSTDGKRRYLAPGHEPVQDKP